MVVSWPQIDSAAALVFGAATIGVGWLSYKAGVKSHNSHLRLEAMFASDSTLSILEELDDERTGLSESFRRMDAAQAWFNSEANQSEFDDFTTATEELRRAITAASERIAGLRGCRLELLLVEIRAIHRRASGLQEDFIRYQREIWEGYSEHRARTLAAMVDQA